MTNFFDTARERLEHIVADVLDAPFSDPEWAKDVQAIRTALAEIDRLTIELSNWNLNAQYMARLQEIDRLTAVNEDLVNKNTKLQEALNFYADKNNWRDSLSWEGGPARFMPKSIPILLGEEGRPCDCGDTARKVLASVSAVPVNEIEEK